MQSKNFLLRDKFFPFILSALVTLLFFNARGTGDVETFRQWSEILDRNGLVRGYALAAVDYPPISYAIVWIIPKFARWFNLEFFTVFKWSLIIFLTLTSFIFWLWTRQFWLAVVLHLALLHNSVALGYLDIYFAPTLLLSLWALQQRRWALFAILFGIAFLTKWQPLIIFPFLAIYILRLAPPDWKENAKIFLLHVALPLGAMIVTALAIFQQALLKAFAIAMNHTILSGIALNFSWLITYHLETTYPQQYGALDHGLTRYIFVTDSSVIWLPKFLFFAFYALTLFAFVKRAQGFPETIKFSIMGFLAYFVFNTGVHENHLFIPALLSVVLYALDRKQLPLVFFCVAMNILNTFIFDGTGSGQGLGFSYLVGVDITLAFALFNVIFFLMTWVKEILPVFVRTK